MIEHWKPLGGFIENTIRPLIEEGKWFLTELERQKIPVNEKNISKIITKIAEIQIITLAFELVKAVLITGIICFTYARFVCSYSHI